MSKLSKNQGRSDSEAGKAPDPILSAFDKDYRKGYKSPAGYLANVFHGKTELQDDRAQTTNEVTPEGAILGIVLLVIGASLFIYWYIAIPVIFFAIIILVFPTKRSGESESPQPLIPVVISSLESEFGHAFSETGVCKKCGTSSHYALNFKKHCVPDKKQIDTPLTPQENEIIGRLKHELGINAAPIESEIPSHEVNRPCQPTDSVLEPDRTDVG